MPGDPKECRLNAERCLRLAKRARRPEALAAELESDQGLLRALSEFEFSEPYYTLPVALSCARTACLTTLLNHPRPQWSGAGVPRRTSMHGAEYTMASVAELRHFRTYCPTSGTRTHATNRVGIWSRIRLTQGEQKQFVTRLPVKAGQRRLLCLTIRVKWANPTEAAWRPTRIMRSATWRRNMESASRRRGN
jgi:hypothetical protein